MDGTTLAGVITVAGVAVVFSYLWGVQSGFTLGQQKEENDRIINHHTVGTPGDIP